MGYWLTGLLLVSGLALAALSMVSRKTPELGLTVEGYLMPCPASPNCVNSEEGEAATSYIAPLPAPGPSSHAWNAATEAVRQAGGTIQKEEKDYLWATFTTPLLRFVDDVELRQDEEREVIHIRSASRVGRSDFGTNRKRVEGITRLYCRLLQTPCP